MTDWNPAEIIGIKPNQLSYSLYSELLQIMYGQKVEQVLIIVT